MKDKKLETLWEIRFDDNRVLEISVDSIECHRNYIEFMRGGCTMLIIGMTKFISITPKD